MISDALLDKLLIKYAQDCNFGMTPAERFRAYYERQKLNPSEEFQARRKIEQDARKNLRSSKSLEGLVSTLSQQIQSIKGELAKKIKRKIAERYKLLPAAEQTPDRWKLEIEKFPACKEFVRDEKRMYHLRDKIKEFSYVYDITALPMSQDRIKIANQLLLLCESFINTNAAKYKYIVSTVQNIIETLKSLL